MQVYLPVPLELFLVYVAASRLLRGALGPAAPDVTELAIQEFMHRRPKSIAEEYLELHGHPTLRTCRQTLARARRTGLRPGKRKTNGMVLLRPETPTARAADPRRN